MDGRLRSVSRARRLCFAAAFAAWPAGAHAQSAPDPLCGEALSRAVAARDAERWAEVVATLEPLGDRCPVPIVYYALARSYVAVGRYRSVRAVATRFFQVAGERVSAEGRAEMESIVRDAQSALATISLTVATSGAQVLLDGAPVDPSHPIEVDPGAHRVVVQRQRFRERVLELNLARGERLTETIVLERSAPPAGRLRISSNVSSATIRVNGVVRGRGAIDVELAPGAAVLEVTDAQHLARTARAEVRDDELTSVRIELLPRPRPPIVWWPYVVGGAVAVAVGTTLGVVLGRREYDGTMGRVLEVDLAR